MSTVIELTPADDVERRAFRDLIAVQRARGVTVRERRRWLFFVSFELEVPDDALPAVQAAIDQTKGELQRQRAW